MCIEFHLLQCLALFILNPNVVDPVDESNHLLRNLPSAVYVLYVSYQTCNGNVSLILDFFQSRRLYQCRPPFVYFCFFFVGALCISTFRFYFGAVSCPRRLRRSTFRISRVKLKEENELRAVNFRYEN